MAGRLRAKFVVWSVDHLVGSRQIVANAVYGKDGTDNGSWSQYTPTGKLTMTITNAEAFDVLNPGDEVYLDITVATPATAE